MLFDHTFRVLFALAPPMKYFSIEAEARAEKAEIGRRAGDRDDRGSSVRELDVEELAQAVEPVRGSAPEGDDEAIDVPERADLPDAGPVLGSTSTRRSSHPAEFTVR
jgi:hypothetical protein